MMMAHHDDVDGTEEHKHSSCWQQMLVVHNILHVSISPMVIFLYERTPIDGTIDGTIDQSIYYVLGWPMLEELKSIRSVIGTPLSSPFHCKKKLVTPLSHK